MDSEMGIGPRSSYGFDGFFDDEDEAPHEAPSSGPRQAEDNAEEKFPTATEAAGSGSEPELKFDVKPVLRKKRSGVGRRKKKERVSGRNSWKTTWDEVVAAEKDPSHALGSLIAIWEEEENNKGLPSPIVRTNDDKPAAPMPQKFQSQLHSVSDRLSRFLLVLQPHVMASQRLESELCTLQIQIQQLCEGGGKAAFDVHPMATSADAARPPSHVPERCTDVVAAQNLPSVTPTETPLHSVTTLTATQLPAAAGDHDNEEGRARVDSVVSAYDPSWEREPMFKRAKVSVSAGRSPLIPNTDDMKRAVREAASKKSYHVYQMYHTTGVCQKIARSGIFEWITMVFILSSSLWIAVEADHNNADLLLEAHPVFIAVENMFCAFFTFEWCIRFGAFRSKVDAFNDAWFSFDSMLLIFMLFDTWLLLLMSIFFGDFVRRGLHDASILRLVRLLRLCRVARLTKILCAMPELMVLFKGLSVAFRAVVATLGLLAVVIYIFSIMFRQLARGTELEERYFSSIPNSMGMLLLTSVTPDLVDYYSEDFAKEYFYFGVLFFFFILVVTFTVLNLLVGVLVNVVAVVAKMEQEEVQVIALKKQITDMFAQLDEDGDCLVSREEFNNLLVRKELTLALSEAGVDCVGLVDVAQFIFDQHEGEVEIGQLLDLVLQLRGSNAATVKDIVDFRRLLSQEFHRLEDRIFSFARAVNMASKGPC